MAHFWQDPPPQHVFELSEAGVAYAQGSHTGFRPLPAGALKASPSADNLVKMDAAAALVAGIAPGAGSKKNRPAAVLLPDAAARVAVLDFDSFPDSPEDQLSLVRFRVKKTIPFDIDSAAVSFYRQPGTNCKGKIEVVAVTVALEVLARYEALFRNAGFHPGEVTISALSALNLYSGDEPAILAKLAGQTLTVMVVAGGKLKLFRCLPLEESPHTQAFEEEILRILYPTFAYAEDELGLPVKRLIVCGLEEVPKGLPCQAEPLHSKLGVLTAFNAGLLGYLEAAS